jgi:hypothetical protein
LTPAGGRRGFLGALVAFVVTPLVVGCERLAWRITNESTGRFVEGYVEESLLWQHATLPEGADPHILANFVYGDHQGGSWTKAVATGLFLCGFLWTTPLQAAEPCRGADGKFIECPDHLEDLQPVPLVETSPDPSPSPSPSPSVDFAIDGGAGLGGTLTSEGNEAEPIAEIGVGFDVSTKAKSPRLDLWARYGTLPGTTPSLEDPTAFQSAAFELRLSQPLADSMLLRPALLVGLEIRIRKEGLEPRHNGARFIYLGVQFAGARGYVFLGGGGDERVSTTTRDRPDYLPAVTASWLLKVRDLAGGNLRAYLTGRVLAFLRLGYSAASAGTTSAQFGFMVGGGNKR